MANNSSCSVCVNSLAQGVHLDQEEHTNTFYAELLDVSEASVRRHYKHGPDPKLGERDVTMQSEVTETSSTGTKSVTGYAAVRDRPVTMEDARDWLRSSGDRPEDFHVSVRSIAYGDGLFSNKLSAWPNLKKIAATAASDEVVLEDFDPIECLRNLRAKSPVANTGNLQTSGSGVFVISLNDTQFGKDENGGTPATLARLDKYLAMVEARVMELRLIGRSIGTLVIIGGGDIIEGCTIYPNQSYSLDLTRRGQINTAVTAILDTIDRLAPYFDDVIVLATRGNHGENRINGHKTTLYDNDDTMVFEMARLATERDPALQHVEYTIAEAEAGVYVDVAGWRLATTHGDVYGKGVQGATQDKKAQNWFKNMAAGRDPIGAADLLITHHFHHDKLSDWGACLWRQTPAMDGGSEYFRQSTGEYSLPGMLTFVMTPQERLRDEQVLR